MVELGAGTSVMCLGRVLPAAGSSAPLALLAPAQPLPTARSRLTSLITWSTALISGLHMNPWFFRPNHP